MVRKGDMVERGDVLARLHGTRFKSSVGDLSEQITALEIRRMRLEAELAGRFDFDVPGDVAARSPETVASERAPEGAPGRLLKTLRRRGRRSRRVACGKGSAGKPYGNEDRGIDRRDPRQQGLCRCQNSP